MAATLSEFRETGRSGEVEEMEVRVKAIRAKYE
jgi:hypothetical protein